MSRENLGEDPALVAASSLLIDYVLTVSVSVVAGVAAITSAVPSLAPHAVALSLGFVALLTVANLRGVKESGRAFAIPTYGFVAAVYAMLLPPLAGVKASVSSLRQTDVDWSEQERRELLATIEQSADRLDVVVRNLLDASRLQAGVLSVQAEAIALDEMVSAAILGVPDAAGNVAVEVPDDLPLVEADRGLLERVLVNLLDNACATERASDRSRSRPWPAARARRWRSRITAPASPESFRTASSSRSSASTTRAPPASGWDSPWPAASSRRWEARWSPTRPREAA